MSQSGAFTLNQPDSSPGALLAPRPDVEPKRLDMPAPPGSEPSVAPATTDAAASAVTAEAAAFSLPEAALPETETPTLPLPKKCPFLLRVSQKLVSCVCAVLGITSGIATSVAAFQFSPPGSMIGHVFDPRSEVTLVPVAISCLFFYAFGMLLFRAHRLAAVARLAKRSMVVTLSAIVAKDGPAAAAARLDHPAAEASPLLRRCSAALRQWSIKPGLAEADLAVQHHVAADYESMQAAYNGPRTIVWALPVLGLSGAVIGISLAVGGFAEFLGSDVNDIAAVKENLVGVTSGLSFSFLITIHGLVTALILMFQAAAVQAREERLLADVQDWTSEIFLPVLQRTQTVPEPDQPSPHETLRVFQEELGRAGERLLSLFGRIGARHLVAIRAERRAFGEAAKAWVDILDEGMHRGGTALRDEASQAVSAITRAAADAARDASTALAGVVTQTSSLLTVVQAQQAGNAELQQELTSALREQTAAVQEAGTTIAALTTAAKLSAKVELEALDLARKTAFGPALQAVAEQLAAQAQETRSAADVVQCLSETTQALTTGHATLQQGIRALHEMGMNETLTRLSGSLERLEPVLQHFHQPFVLKAVPAREVERAAP